MMPESDSDETIESPSAPPPGTDWEPGSVTPENTVEQDPASAGRVPQPSRVPSGDATALSDCEPVQLGRYKILRKLGSGGFGVVYLGFDEILARVIAIKVPRAERVGRPEQAEAYLAEARLVANLEHPAIVRVYDCGQEGDVCYVVSQYIDAGDLSDWLKGNRAETAWAVQVVIRVSEALHHAHKSRIVHRDVKPSNILLDGEGVPYLADFGLAMREQEFGKGSGYAGTPRYMSPEQARGEGQRVDGRSDVYSLGVVLYELLTHRVPFESEQISELLEQIQTREPPPMRLAAEGLPEELERIVLKSLAKRAADRYSTAADFAEDLQHWLTAERRGPSTLAHSPSGGRNETPGSNLSPAADTRPPRVVPKGLRAFDANDADFFLKLIPGPRDRDGLPESIRYWKHRLESTEATSTFAVGLMYGPSGCGKTSFLRAGLLPRLGTAVLPILVEATTTDTEAKLFAAVKKARRDVAHTESLSEALALIRRQPVGKIVLIIDQFEQWLSAHAEVTNSELFKALRQCDGVAVQAVLLVRDDFWMAAKRFFQALEITLQEGHNSEAIDLFDPEHARKVLAGFGRAFGRLPARRTEYTSAQNEFLNSAVKGLGDAAGRVVCVRLTLFAEMVKGKPWEPSTLARIGGLDGVGVAFLEETFGSGATPAHRNHDVAARGVLKALLPPFGTNIKTTMATREILLTASGYGNRPQEFDALMKMLDNELRLVTLTESANDASGSGTHYQLTHDFLVPSLHDWLTRKQQETRRGRAELLLAERASLWAVKPEPRFLPSLSETISIRTLTKPQHWTEPEQRMMARATWRYGLRVAAACVVAGVAIATLLQLLEMSRNKEADALVKQIPVVNPYLLPSMVEQYRSLRARALPLVDTAIALPRDSREKLQLQIARDSDDPARLKEILGELSA
ncbi:hypothetical protein BH11PLA2_BH11PLA2_06810 [soil metagenome]